MIRLGELYDKGVAGGRDVEMAKHNLQMDAVKGSKIAAQYLKDLNELEE